MMRRSRLRRAGWQPRLLLRLERAARLMNPFLMVIALGLLVVNVSCYVALEIGRLHVRHHAADRIEEANPPLGEMAVIGLPRS